MQRREVLAALACSLAACLLPSARAANLDDLKAAGSLRVAVYRDFPPFSYLADGELTGIDIDLAHALGRKLGLTVQFMVLTATEDVDGDLRNAVWKGHYLGGGTADLMLHVPFDPELARRNDNVHLFGAYYREQLAWGGSPAPASLWQIERQRIAVENDSLADLYLSALQGGRLRAQLQHYPQPQQAVAAVRDSQADAVLGSRSELEWGLRGQWPVHVPQAPGLLKAGWELGMATKESLRDLAWALGDALTELKASGELAGLFARYGVSYRPADDH